MENIITLNDDQNRALKKAKEWWLNESDKRPFILEGCAGSGKTTIVKFLVEEINLEDNKICFCTFTGKAASQLQRKGNNASTIHKLIYIPYEDVKTKEIKFRLKNKEEFNYEIELIIVDEYAMVDDKLMTDLESFGVPIILIGDPYQLPPIGTPNKYISLKNNLKDIILTKPMRQALDSPIIYLANKARNKERIDYGEYGNCTVSPRNSIDVEEFMKADQIIAGKNDTVKRLNRFYRIKKGINSILPKKGEKLMCLKNNWGIECSEGSITTSVINGLTGILETDITEDKILNSLECSKVSIRPEFFSESCFYNIYIDNLFFKNDWNNQQELWNNRNNYKNLIKARDTFKIEAMNGINPFTFGYVCTCYKYQGSEAPNVFFIQEYMGKQIYAQHLYTGITRASEKLNLVL